MGIEFRVVNERSDTIADVLEEAGLLDPVSNELQAPTTVVIGGNSRPIGGNDASGGGTVSGNSGVGSGAVPSGQLWNETAITIYQTADFDICVGGG